MIISSELIADEFEFTATRSSGPGGQHVNKVNSKITLRWNLAKSILIDEGTKERLVKKLENRISKEGNLIITCQESKSQSKNKETAIEKMLELVNGALFIKKKRKATKPTKASVKRRLEGKKRAKDKKDMRRRPDNE